MPIIRKLKDISPRYGKNCFFAENAAIIGDVRMGDDCSIWYGAVLRGDVNPIRIGNRVNIQDGAVLHTSGHISTVEMGDDVSVGHNAIIHGAKIGNNVLIGMGAIVMDNAVVPDNTIVAAGAVVLANTVLEPGIWAGVPAKKVKDGSQAIARMNAGYASSYLECKSWYLEDDNETGNGGE